MAFKNYAVDDTKSEQQITMCSPKGNKGGAFHKFPFPSWITLYLQPRLFIIALLGFSSGVPLLLTSSTLAIWLAEKGVRYATVGLFGCISFPYALKFIWAPLVDRMPIPFLTRRFGRRRSWLILSQLTLMVCITLFALIDPAANLLLTAFLALCIAFCAATQETVVMTYQLESLTQQHYGPGGAMGILGYRMGMLVAGAGTLYIASLASWELAYMAMTVCVGIGLLTTLSIREPKQVISQEAQLREEKVSQYLQHHPWLKGLMAQGLAWLHAAVVCPFIDFMKQKGWFASLLLMFFYKLSDNFIGTMGNIFYLELGFSKIEIANASKLFGVWASVFGGFIAGIILIRMDFLKGLFLFCVLHAFSTLMYIVMFYVGYSMEIFYIAIALEHITSGMRTTALFSYQLTLCNVSYAATQGALVSSLVTLGRTIFSSMSGWLVEQLGWFHFFFLAFIASFPALLIIGYLLKKRRTQKKTLLSQT